MRYLIILKILEEMQTVPLTLIKDKIGLSERSLRAAIQVLKKDGKNHGFDIITIRGSGYQLMIKDKGQFEAYKNQLFSNDDISNRQDRIPQILYYLFQQSDYISLQMIADLLDVSRNTIISDLDEVKKVLEVHELKLDSKSHYGVRIIGEEKAFRSAFSKYVMESARYTSIAQNYFDFASLNDMDELTSFFVKQLDRSQLKVTENSIMSIVDHLKVLVYRVKTQNFIADIQANKMEIEPHYVAIARSVIEWLEEKQALKIPEAEVLFLASQIAGKTTAGLVPEEERLILIDEEFYTEFNQDEMLKDALLLHMYPLLKRISYSIELENPLVEMVSSRYANVFLVALRFSELWDKQLNLTLSRDEMGYLALHFASYIERRKQQAIDSIKRIVIVSAEGGGSAYLIRSKLDEIFPNAIIANCSLVDMLDMNNEAYDLIFSTVPIKSERLKTNTPIIYIKPLIDEEEIKRIKEQLIHLRFIKEDSNHEMMIKQLFNESLFYRDLKGDYLSIIEKMAKDMIKKGYARDNFVELVLEREKRFTTIYQNGVAGPHGMVLNAIRDSIALCILKEPVKYNSKKVQIIFLLNIKDGNLFMYREISRLLLKLMEDESLIKKIVKAKDFTTFSYVLDQML